MARSQLPYLRSCIVFFFCFLDCLCARPFVLFFRFLYCSNSRAPKCERYGHCYFLLWICPLWSFSQFATVREEKIRVFATSSKNWFLFWLVSLATTGIHVQHIWQLSDFANQSSSPTHSATASLIAYSTHRSEIVSLSMSRCERPMDQIKVDFKRR